MNKNLITGIVILLLLSGGVYAMNLKKSSTPKPQSTTQAVNEAAEFANAIESGKPTTCTLTKGSDTMEYIIKGKMMRANTTTVAVDSAGKSTTTVGHMINDTISLYIWSDGQKQGSKMPIPSPLPSSSPSKDNLADKEAPKFATAADYDAFKNEGYTINCKAGSVDDLSFTPPSDIKFIDPTEMLKQLPVQGASGNIDIEKLQQQYGQAPSGE